ncbi:MAG: hypothetical protein IJP24_06470 [Firmicutes bacterium]|nr:hypothetical protein [Bacillota bacterium]
MKNSLRCTLAILLALTMLFSLAACGGDTGGEEQPETSGQDKTEYTRSHMGNKVNSPNEIYYFVENPIEIITIDAFPNGETQPEDYPSAWEYSEMSEENKAQYVESDARFDGNYIQISGLKDKEIEDKINAKLKQHYIDNVGLIPPYRGIKQCIGENPVIPESKYYYPTASMYSSGNLNNILSVTFSYYAQYLDAEGRIEEWGSPVQYYVSYLEPINIDLNTGEEVPLEALFCDDIDPYAYLNGVVKEELRNGNGDEEGWFVGTNIQLSGQFTGIKPDQKYSLGVSGITLIFDYETPEFLTSEFGYSTITIPYRDVSAVTARFYDPDENIYESDEPAIKMFPYEYNIKNEPLKEENYQVDNTYVYLTGTVIEGTPDVIKEELLGFLTVTDEEVREVLEPAMSEALMMKDPESSIDSQFYRHASTSKFGPFMNAYKSDNHYITEYGPNKNASYLEEYVAYNDVYDLREVEKGILEPLELADLFYDNVDVEERIKYAMRKSIERQMEYETPGVEVSAVLNNDEIFEEYLDKLYDNITSFRMDRKLINLTIEDTNGIFCSVYGVETVEDIPYGWRYAYGPTELHFEDLGYENISIFD